MTNIKIGFGETDITPKRKIKLAGQFFERITDEVESPVSVTALALECGEEQAVICSCDLESVTENLVEKVRDNLKNVAGLNTKKIIISATHTHTSYLYADNAENSACSTLGLLRKYMPEDREYTAQTEDTAQDTYEVFLFLAEKIAEAIRLAWENRADGYFAGGFGRAAVGMCRRVVYDDGTARMWGDTNLSNFQELEGGNDSGIELLYFFDAGGELTGIAANIACPSQIVEQRSFISSDYWGKVKSLLRESFGKDIYLLGLCAPAGDQCPRDLIRWVEPETPVDDPNIPAHSLSRRADPSMYDVAGLWKAGRRIAHEIVDAFGEAEARMQSETELVHIVEKIDLPSRRATITEYEDAKEKIDTFFKNTEKDAINFKDMARMHVYAGLLSRYELQQRQNTVPVELHVLRLGDMAICTSPFELFLNYGNLIRARSMAKQTFLLQLTNGSCGYLPTEKAERGSHYSAYISSGMVGHMGGEQLVRVSLERINNMF